MNDAQTTLEGATPRGPRQAVEASEHLAAVIRMRMASRIGGMMWSASFAFDVLNATTLMGSLAQLIALRGMGTMVIFGAWLRLRSARATSPLLLRLLVVGTFATCSALFALMAAVASGLPSPYFGGAMLMQVVWGVVVSEHWRRGLVDAAVLTLAYPACLLFTVLLSPALAAQLRDPVATSVFASNVGNLLIAYVVVVIGGHVSWRLRRQVFENRDLGRYRLKRLIGQGGMGEVWAAHHVALKRDVAVKILRGDHALSDAHAVARFEREVRATTELVHPNTIRVFDYGVSDDGVSFYAMELLEGESLSALVEREGPLSPARAIHIVTQAARALAEAHGKGIVHRDVKPDNLFVVSMTGESDFVKVLDFGIAMIASSARDAKLTRSGSVVGTPAWLAPESIRGGVVDARADVYALGAVLYFTLAGAPPFERETGLAMMTAHLYETASSPSLRRGESLPRDVEAVVARCLAKDPKARFPSARELAEALGGCVDVGYRPGAKPISAPARAPVAPMALAEADTLEGPGKG